jgi:hypothetical protein
VPVSYIKLTLLVLKEARQSKDIDGGCYSSIWQMLWRKREVERLDLPAFHLLSTYM